jgi:hypothetical protein
MKKETLKAIIVEEGVDRAEAVIREIKDEVKLKETPADKAKQKEKEMEAFLLSFIGKRNYTVTKDAKCRDTDYLAADLYYKDGQIFMSHNKENGELRMCVNKIWHVFHICLNINYNYEKIQAFIKKFVEKTLKLENITPVVHQFQSEPYVNEETFGLIKSVPIPKSPKFFKGNHYAGVPMPPPKQHRFC